MEELIQAGKTESSEYTLAESLHVMRIMDHVRAQLGVVYPADSS